MEEYISESGDLFTVDKINQIAKDNNTTFESIVKMNKLTLKSKSKVNKVIEEPGKPKPVAKEDVPATVKSMASKSAKPSLELKSDIWGEDRSKPEFLQEIQKVSQPDIKFPKPVSVKKPKQELKSISEYQAKAKKEEETTFSNFIKESFDSGVSTIVKSFYKAPEYIYNAAAIFTNPVADLIGNITGVETNDASSERIMETFGIKNIPADILQERISKSDKIIKDFGIKNGVDPLTAIENGNYLGAAKLTAGSTIQSFPMMMAAMLSGGSSTALAGISASTAITKADQLQREQPEMDVQTRTVNAAVSGLLEGYLGNLFTGASGAVVKRILTDKGTKEGAKVISNGLMGTLEKAIEKNPMIGVLGEVAEESSVELGNQLNDINSGIRKELDYRAITNAGIIATGMAGTNTIPVYGAKGYMKMTEYNQVKAVNKEINTLTNQLSNPYINDSDKKIISSRVNRLVDENKTIVGASLEKIKALPENIKTEINTINTDLDDIKSKYLDLADNDAIPLDVKAAMGEELKLQGKQLYDRKNSIIEGNYIYEDFNKLSEKEQIKFKEEANNTIVAENEKLGITTSPKVEDIDRKAVNLYNTELKIQGAAKEVELIQKLVPSKEGVTLEKGIGKNNPVEVFNTPEELQSAYEKYHIENTLEGEPKDVKDQPGFILPNGQIIINKTVAENVEEGATVGRHELLHKVLKSSFSDSEQGIKLKDKFLSVLSEKELNVVNKRLKDRGYTEEDLKQAPDEYLTQFFEALNTKEIEYSDSTFLNMWKKFLQPIYKKLGFKKLDFTSGSDVYNFIKDYHKSVSKGVLSERAIALKEKGETTIGKTAMSKTPVELVKEKIADLEENEGDYDPDEYDQEVARLEGELKRAIAKEKAAPAIKKEVTEEDAVKEIIKNEKGSISSDKVQQIYDSKGKEGADEIIKLFKPITNKIVDKRRDAPGFDRELLTDEIETGVGGILDLITKYDPKQGIPLAAYINKYLPVRAIATSRRVLETQFTKDAAEEKGLMATETADQGFSETAKEKAKYKNALESKVFEPEVLKTVSNKIITILRTLKTRIDTPITLNRTVTPLIAEIRDEVGKQLDIDIKTMLGGKKDGVLKKQLLKNKKYILENMTTTWLMGKDGQGGMPIAIQKQIDGKWVNFPDWVGQKIDREKTTTDQAGRTSGSELVRRLPNVNNNISNEDFLAQVIGPDGNPLRGRKESLSKAIAEEGAFDIINNDLENEGPIYEAFTNNQQRLGVELIDNVAVEVARQSERGNIKFSLTVPQFNNFSAELFHAASDYGIDSNEVNTILNTIPYEDRDKVKQHALEDHIDLVAKLQKIKAGVRGTAYEKIILKELKTLKIKGIKVLTKKVKGFDSTGEGDINLQLGKDILNIEVKLNALAQMGSFSINADLDNNTFSVSKKLDLPKELIDKLKEKNNNFKAYKKAAEKLGIDTKTWPYKITKDQHYILKSKGFQKALTVSIDTDQKVIEQLYNDKNVYYINIGKQGLFALGEDKLNLGVPLLSSKVKLTARLVRGGDYNRIRVFPTLINFKQKSKYNVDNAASNNAMFTQYKNNTEIKENTTTINAVTKSLISYSKTPKGISVFDFDDTVGITKSNVLYTMPGDQIVYHGAPKGKDVTKISDKGVKFFATDKREADEYARINSGTTQQFVINNSQIVDEEVAINKMKELGLTPKNKEFEIDDAQLYELIDTRFEESLSKSDITKLFDALKKDGVKALSYSDGAQVSGKFTTSIAVIDPSIISVPKKLNAEEFAKEGAAMLEAGAVFDFSEFSKVVDGKPGPMVEKMKKMIGKFGPENFFILTARPANAAGPIHEFLSSIGIDIPLKNITGLGSSLAQSKADWMTAKAAEGYNDFYFSDDAIQNVDAVKNALEVLDVKSKIQQARLKFSKTISPEFNKIIEENKGMEHYKVFSDIVARRRGKSKNKYDFYVPPSAADFELLLYNFLGKGERGEEQQKFFNEALLKPYANGNDLMDAARQSIKKDYKALLDSFPDIRKKMETLTPDGDYTYDQAIRVAMWNEESVEIPGISERDSRKLTDLVNNDPELAAFKQGLIVTGRQGKGWINPTEYWDANTIIADLHGLTEGEGRKKFLAEFIDNAEQMFGTWSQGKLIGPNINKVEAVYGTNVREAIEDVLYRMTTGKNRSQGKDKETSAWSNWVNGSTGAIMFLNTRSAALQLIGAVNFLNLRDNNPIAAGKAFLNQPQYWKDFSRIWNSDKMKERRGGLKEDVAAAEIANAAAGSKNKPAAVIAYLLKIGYTPTQLADSFAIASGGAPFYRNRVKSYLKEGLTEQEAEDAAWGDFTKVSDETQQSGDPRDISKQQASGAGRLLLTFQNTAMQQSRIVKKSYMDLKAGRGDAKTHIAKITYYLAVQNTLFAVLQQGLFAVAFDDDDEEVDKEKGTAKKKTLNDRLIDVADGVLDTVLRGTGFAGGIVSVLKNMTKKYLDEKDKNFKADYAKVVLEGANISPPIGSKLRKVYTGLQQTKFERDLIKERGWSVMQDGRVHLGPMYGVTGKLAEATTNLPIDRLVNKIENISQAMNSENQAWQRVAVGVGFTPYSVGIEESKGDVEIRAKAKEIRKEEGKIKSAETRQRTKDSIRALPVGERIRLKREAALKRREEKIKKRKRKMG